MLKIVNTLLISSILLNASEYYAKIVPIETYNIKSSVSGKVVYVNKNLESTSVKDKIIIQIDSKIDTIDLKHTQEKLKITKQIVALEKQNLKRLNKISSKSQFEKDNQKIKILNLKSSITDLQQKIDFLKDKILNKTIKIDNLYIYDIIIQQNDYVNPGTLLLTAMDISKTKLDFFVPINEITKIKNKTIYLDNKKTNYKISKISKISDTKYISSYRCEIIIPNNINLSHLTKIEFKDN